MGQRKDIIITSGDLDGIGLEVALKALLKIGPKKDLRFVLYLGVQRLSLADLDLLQEVKSKFVFCSQQAFLKDQHELLLLFDPRAPAFWVEEATQLCLKKKASAICTAPLSKPSIIQAGLTDLGHTDILRRVCRTKSVNMAFVGRHFNVVLATGHIPLFKLKDKLTSATLKFSIKNTLSLRSALAAPTCKLPVGLLGLNPHAGDAGLIGDFDAKVLAPLSKKFGSTVSPPLVPDVAFNSKNWQKYSVYLAMYHDQGLIPFKLAHGFDNGVHISLGLPIIRTSVDHGTAKDIYGLNQALPGSMIDALNWAIKLAKLR